MYTDEQIKEQNDICLAKGCKHKSIEEVYGCEPCSRLLEMLNTYYASQAII